MSPKDQVQGLNQSLRALADENKRLRAEVERLERRSVARDLERINSKLAACALTPFCAHCKG